MRKRKIEEWVKGLEMKNGRLSVEKIASEHLASISDAIYRYFKGDGGSGTREIKVPWKAVETLRRHHDLQSMNRKLQRAYSLQIHKIVKGIWRSFEFFQKHGPQTIDKLGKKVFFAKIRRFVEEKEPIKIFFIAWPFKNYLNPLKTNRKTPDLGELIFVQRLLQINGAVQRKYPPGIEWTVLTEGEVYRDLLGASKEDAVLYLEGMKKFIKLLKGEEIIKTRDLKAEVQGSEFEEKYQRSLQIFREWDESWISFNTTIKPFIKVMFHSQDVSDIPLGDLMMIFYGEEWDLTSRQKELKLSMLTEARKMAEKYVAFQEAKTEIISRKFAGYLHFGITYSSHRFSFEIPTKRPPHHGVTLTSKWHFDLVYLIEILKRPEQFAAVYVEDDQEKQPFYYKRKETDAD